MLLCGSAIALLSTNIQAQVTVNGRNPQLPDALGPNGGLKVECIAGTCTGSGGAAPDVNVTNTSLPVSQFGAWVVAQSGTWTISNTGFNVNNFPTTASTSAISVRCVNAAGNAFESCAGGGGATGLTDTELRANPVDVSLLSVESTAGIPTGTAISVQGVTGGVAIPVSGTFWPATQPISGTVTANAGTGTFTVGGTVTTTPPSNASTNITQWNGTAVSTNTGTRDAGTLRVTIATNDSVPVTGTFFQATQPVSLASLPSLATGSNAIGSITNTAFGITGAIPAGTNNIGDVDVLTMPNVAIAGTVANNAAITQNPVLVGLEVRSQGTQPTAATTGNQRQQLATVEGVAFVQEGNSNRFSCFVQAVTATTQCQAAPGAGLRAYITSFSASNQAATVQTLDIVFGTGSNCVTGITALTHKYQFGTNATTTSPYILSMQFTTPLIPTAANAICVRPSAATAFGATITGYIAP